MRNALLGDYTQLKMNKAKEKWDGKWRLIIYDIPEKRKGEREYLRRLLQLLGFGKIQASAWASPYDYSNLIYELCKKRNLLDYICLYEGKFFAGKEIDVLAKKAWDLKNIKGSYQEIVERCEFILDEKEQKPFSDICNEYFLFITCLSKQPQTIHFYPRSF